MITFILIVFLIQNAIAFGKSIVNADWESPFTLLGSACWIGFHFTLMCFAIHLLESMYHFI
jgi:phosphate starvation-inducible membrane PsiE